MSDDDLFTGTRGPHSARILIVGEAWGAMEERFGKPFMGESGNELKNMLREAGLDPDECLYTNVVSHRPENNNFTEFLYPSKEAKSEKHIPEKGVYPRLRLREGRDRLHRLISLVRPAIIIALGNWALWALGTRYGTKNGDRKTGTAGYKVASGIDTYRGSMERTPPDLHSIPLLATYHPAAVLRMWPWRHIAVSDLRRVREYLEQPKDARVWGFTPSIHRHLAPSPSIVDAWVEYTLEHPYPDGTIPLTLDLETFAGKIHIMGLSQPDATRLVVPFMHVDKSGTRPYYPLSDWKRLYSLLRHLLVDPRVRLVGQNLLYDAQYLANEFAYVPKIGFDSMVAQHLLWPAMRRGLDFMASLYSDQYTYWKDDRKDSLANEDNMKGMEYNALDLDYTEEVCSELRRQLSEAGIWHLFYDRMELVEIVLDMMLRGVPTNAKTRQGQIVQVMHTMQELVHWMENAIPDFLKPEGKKNSKPWYASDTKLRELFYENLRLHPIIDKETGQPTLNRDALKRLGFMYPEFKPLFGAITLYRSARIFNGTFLQAKLENDGHFRCSYTITTETGRLASSENVFGRGGNLANIPRDREPLHFFNAIEALS